MSQHAVFEAHLREATKLTDLAVKGKRSLTPEEKAKVEHHLAKAQEVKDNLKLVADIEAMRGPVNTGAASKGIGDQLVDAGFDLKHAPSVTLDGYAALGAKAPTLPGSSDINPTPTTMVPLGRDTRYLWPNLVRQDAGTNTAVSDFRQTVRTVTGSIERAIDATTNKAELDVTVTHVVEALKQVAVTISNVPNAILEASNLLRQFFDAEGRFQVETALDAHVINQIVASAPPFGTTGTGLVAQVRNAVTSMRAEGANPSLLVLNAADAASLDLTSDAGGYVFPLNAAGASPLWGLRVIERPGTTPPYVIDPTMLGVLYLGSMRFDADPYTGFKQNLTNLRVEANALFHVRNARGARRIAAA